MTRRILLIDADPAFHASLAQQLGRYRFEIAAEPDVDQAFAVAAETPPALLVVAVDEPDKAGFKVFQRCKRSALAKVPIMLVTSSVAPESFAKHKSLKVHADDYLDKRSIADDELLGKIDSLVGLGEPADDELDTPLEVDEIALSSDDMVLEETVGEDDGDGGSDQDGHHVDSMVDAETDAAFAALLDKDVPAATTAAAPERPPSEPPAAGEPDATVQSLPRLADTGPGDEPSEPSVVIAAVPAPIHDTGRPQDSGGIDFDSFSRESMRPPVELIAHARQHHRDHRAQPVEAHESVSAIPIDVDDLEQINEDEAAAPAAARAPVATPAEPEAGKPRPAETSTAVEPRAHTTGIVRDPQTGSYNSAPVPDLGLDEIGEAEARTDHSGIFDRRALRKIGELERQIAQLKTELDRARATADASARGASREREFLNLREQITAKDRDLQRARDDVRARDRDLAEISERLRETQHARAALETRTAELEQRAAADASRAAALEIRDRANANQVAALQQELEARTHAASVAEAARFQLDRELAGERAMRAASASETERTMRVEREQLIARHQAELAGLRGEAAAAREAALDDLRDELDAEHAATIAAAVAAARAETAASTERTVKQLETGHGAELARLKAEHLAALARLTEERDAAIATAVQEREDAVAAVDDEHHEAIGRLQSERARELAAVKAEAEHQLAQVRDELSTELARVSQDAEDRIAALTAQRDRTVAELVGELERTRSQLAAELAEHEAALGAAADDQAAALDEQAQQHADELARRDREHAAARARDADGHREALAALRADLQRQVADHAQALEAARGEIEALAAQHEHDRAALLEDHRGAVDELARSHADELATMRADRQQAAAAHQRALAEAHAAAEQVTAQHRAEIEQHIEAAARDAAEHRTAMLDARRALDEAAARHHAEREAAERDAAKALDDQKLLHERALGMAQGEATRNRVLAETEHARALAAAAAEHERQRKELQAEHAQQIGELTTERDELRRGLSSARDGQKRSEVELASALKTIADRNAELRAHAAAIAERDQRIADLRREVEAIEQENANYQEQVLRAYQKIKADEAMVARAKKAMAIALTVLDDPTNPKADPG